MIYKLKNEIISIQIDSLGAELKSFVLENEEYLYQSNTKYWHRSSPVLFPIIGKLKNNNYKYKNKNYSLAIHGFARHLEFKLIKQNNDSLVFLLSENKSTLKHYPFNFNLEIKYSIYSNSLKIDYKVYSDQEIYFSLGSHPAFILKANINNTYLEFEKKENNDLLCLNLENGCIKGKKENYLKSNILKLNKNIFQKDALIFEKLESDKVILKNTENKKAISVKFKNFSHLGLWAPVNAPFICIEPWCGIADYENLSYDLENKKAIIKLKENNAFLRSLTITLY